MAQKNVLPRGASVTDYYNIYTNGVCQIGDNNTNILTNFTPNTDSASLGIKGNVNCVGISTDVSGSSTGTYYSNSCTALRIPADTSANRPPTGLKGYIRYNTDTNDVEYYNGGNSTWENIAPATPNLQEVLTANNITDLTAEFRDTLVLPSFINTISSTGMSNNNDLALSSGVNMTLNAPNGSITTNSDSISMTTTGNNIGMSSGTSVNITASDGVYLTATNDPMNLTATNVNMALLSADGMTLTTSGNPLSLTANGVNIAMTATDDIGLTSTADAISLTAGLDINLTATTSLTGKVDINATNGVVINQQGITPPDTTITTLNGGSIEIFQDENTTTGIVNQVLFDTTNLFIDNTNNTAQTQSYCRVSPNEIEIYDHINSGTNSSVARISSTAFDYNPSPLIKPQFYQFTFEASDIFRYDTNGLKTANNKTIVLTDGTTTNTINYLGYTTRNSVQNSTHFLNFSDTSATGTGSIQKTAGIECNPLTKTITATTFNGTATSATAVSITDSTTTAGTFYPTFVNSDGSGKTLRIDLGMTYTATTDTLVVSNLTGTASNATNVGITSDNSGGTFYIPFVKLSGSGSRPLFIDDVTAPLTYNASTGTLNSTIFTTATAPVSANQLGNKTYIDNYGGTGGWYYTTTISPSGTTTLSFPNCLDSTYNAYEIYFVSNLSSPTSGYVTFQMGFIGITTPTYQSWTNQTSSTSGGSPTPVNTYNTNAPYLNFAMDFTNYINRAYTYKLDLWGTKSITGGASTGRFQYLTEGQTSSNPGFTGYVKQMGSVGYASGNLTGITLTASSAVTGQFTIVVKAKY